MEKLSNRHNGVCREATVLEAEIIAMPRSHNPDQLNVSCSPREGSVLATGKGRGYYVFGCDGRRVLVLQCRPGDRIRINHTTEVGVLASRLGQVTLAIETSGGGGDTTASRRV